MISKRNVVFYIAIFIFTILSILRPIYLFPPETLDTDKFHGQISYVMNNSISGLSIIHYFRYIVVWPFMHGENLFGPFINSIFVFLLIYYPVSIYLKIEKKINVLYLMIFIVPFFVSLRTTITLISMLYLYIGLLYNFKTLMFTILSLFFGILSSGVIFNILLILFYYYRHKFSLSKLLIIMPIMLLLIYPSVEHKLSFFQTSSSNGFLLNIVLRSNLFSSINDGDFIKFVIYIIILILSIITLSSKSPLTRVCAILAIISVIFLEGLGGISFLGILLLDISRRFIFIDNKRIKE